MWRAMTKRSLRIHDAQRRPDPLPILSSNPDTYFHRKRKMEKKIDQQTMKQKCYMNTHVFIVKILLFQFDRFI